MSGGLVWNGRDADDFAKARIRTAQAQSDLATARVQGMKIAAEVNPPQAAQGSFPYRHRTCAQWTPYEAREAKRDAAA